MISDGQQALDFFQKAVSFIYREIGILQAKNHRELVSKANLQNQFFSPKRKVLAKKIYHETKTLKDIQAILKPYEIETGLTLEDIYRIFAEGEWRNGSGNFSYGGPKWAKIVETTLVLKRSIETNAWDELPILLDQAKKLRHNNGLLTSPTAALDTFAVCSASVLLLLGAYAASRTR